MFAKSLGLAALVAAGSLALPAAAATTITPVGVTATNTFPFWGIYNPENLIDGSGLSGGLHDADYANMWMTDLGVSAAALCVRLSIEAPPCSAIGVASLRHKCRKTLCTCAKKQIFLKTETFSIFLRLKR